MDLTISGIFGLATLAIAVYVILQIGQSSATTGRKALWIVIVLFLPLIGALAWYLMGPKR